MLSLCDFPVYIYWLCIYLL